MRVPCKKRAFQSNSNDKESLSKVGKGKNIKNQFIISMHIEFKNTHKISN